MRRCRLCCVHNPSDGLEQAHLGGVPATTGVGGTVAATESLTGGAMAGGALLRFAMICSFFRSAANRPRMLATTMMMLVDGGHLNRNRQLTFEHRFPILGID